MFCRVARAVVRPFSAFSTKKFTKVSRLFPVLTLLLLALALCTGRSAPAQRPGAPAAQSPAASSQGEAIQGQAQRPLAMVSGDFDEDGAADLAIGYGSGNRGSFTLVRGNADALAPQTQASWLAAGRHESVQPFLQPSKTISLNSAPSLMVSADVNGDGHLDVAYASQGGAQLQVMFGTGHGTFLPQQASFTIPGSIAALAAYRPGAPLAGEALIVGYESSQGPRVGIVSYGAAGLAMNASYPLPGAATVLSVANLDDDFVPDVAIVAGGQLLVLHGSGAINGGGRLETVPVAGVETVTSGEFLFDRRAQLQLAALTSDGSVVILAHQGFDPRPYTPQQIAETRRNKHSLSLAQQAGNTGNEPWTVVETHTGAGTHFSASDVPILMRSRMSGSGGDDLVVLNSAQQQRVVISHSVATAQAPVSAPSRVTVDNIDADSMVAALSMRVNADGRPGLVTLKASDVSPEVTLPSAGNTFYVNTTADNTGTATDPSDGTRCTSGSGEICTLRDAVTFANNDATDNINDGRSDTIMVPSGTYPLTWQAGTFDANGNALAHLEILGPVTIIGSTSGSGVVIDAENNDTVFSINPGPFGSFNPSGDSYLFDAALENLVMKNGKNNNNPNTYGTGLTNFFGGGLNWDAYGTGNLAISNSTIENCTALWGPGGGIWFQNSVGGGDGTLTLIGGTISANSTAEQGGAVYGAYPTAAMTATNTVFSGNMAELSVNSSDPGAQGTAGGLFIAARTGVPATPQTTLTAVTISSNSTTLDGGGIYTNSGILLSDSLVNLNSAGRWGGGVFTEVASPEVGTTITSTNFLENSATAAGGAILEGPETASAGNALQLNLSRIFGNISAGGASGLAVGYPGGSDAGSATAAENWWGCNAGPSTPGDGCDQAVLYNSSTGSMSVAPYAQFALSATNSTSVTFGGSLDLSITLNHDSSGNAISGAFPAVATNYPYSFDVTGVTASPALTSGTFDTAGRGSAILAPSSSGSGTISATFDNQTEPVNFTVNGVDHFVVSAPASAVAGTPFSFTVTALDYNSNTVTGYTGTVHFTSTDPNAVLPANATLVNGVGTFSATLKTAGEQTINATDTVTPLMMGISNGISVGPGALTSFSVTGPDTVVSYTSNELSITALDAFRNTVSSFNGTVSLSSSDPNLTVSSGNPVALANGVVSFNFGLKIAGTQTITATDTANAAITGTTAILVTPGPANSLAITAPSLAYTGSQFPVTLTAHDLYGNVATGYTGTVQFTSTDPSATLPANSTLTNGTGTFNATLKTPGSQTITATDTVTAILTATSGSITVTIPGYVVTTVNDDATGIAANCPSDGSGTDCSLRDALAAASAAGAGNITFSSTVFATPQTITLGTGGTLSIPANTTITGPTTGSGATLVNLVTVEGGGSSSNFSIFTVNSGVTGAAIANLTMTNGNAAGNGGGIDNAGVLTVNASTLSNNTACNGGGISNSGTLTVNASTLSGNYAAGYATGCGDGGGGIYNLSGTLIVNGSTFSANSSAPGGAILADNGTVAVSDSTFSGNSAVDGKAGGAFFINNGSVTVRDSTFSGNSAAAGGGIYNYGALTVTNSILSGDNGGECGNGGDSSCPANGAQGNVIGVSNVTLATLANYGGTTQTMIPLPGSAAICAGLQSGIPTGATTDQRGLPRLNTTYPGYSSSTTCVDAGAVQTNYAIAFTTQPPATANPGQPLSPAPVVQLTESGQVATAASSPIAMSDTASALGGTLSENFAAGSAAFGNLVLNAAASNDTLTATLPLNTSLAIPLNLTAQASVPVTATQITPVITWPTPAAITFGTPLSATQLDASSTVAGTPAYNPAAGAVLTAGQQKLSVTFTPANLAEYASVTSSVMLQVNQATPIINWAPPAPITYGTALSATQLNASSTVGGTFAYNLSAGTVLTAGPHNLTVTFTPNDATDYTTATASVALTVNDDSQTISFSAGTLGYASGVPFGTAPLTLAGTSTSGLPVTFSLLSGPAVLSGNTLTINGAGVVTIAANQAGNSNYTAAPQVTEIIPVNKALPIAAIASSVNPALAQNGIMLTATVTSGVGTPSGTVTFLDGTTPLGTGTLSAGMATLSTSSLAVGAHSITAVYSGDANFMAVTSSSLTQLVEDFGLSITAPTVTSLPGGSAAVTFTVSPISATTFPAAITLTVNGLPPGATYNISPATLTAGGGATTVTLTVNIPQTQASVNPASVNPFTVNPACLHPNAQLASGGNADSHGKQDTNTLRRIAPVILAFILLPIAGRLRRAGKRLSRPMSMVLLLAMGIAALGCLSGCGSATGFFAQQQQSYTVTVTGTSGALSHSATITLTVE